MVLLTVTPAAKAAIKLYLKDKTLDGESDGITTSGPSLQDAVVGSPISHAQLITISKHLREGNARALQSSHDGSFHLEVLLKGATIYTPPSKVKPEQSREYHALMARLREEEEQRIYERMINPPAPSETFAQRFPNNAPPIINSAYVKEEEDDVTYADVNRQLALIINVLVSIIACSVAIWIAARRWTVPQRLALSMTGSTLVAIAEVVIYSGYIRRVREAKSTEAKKLETKEVFETWIIGGEKDRRTSSISESDAIRHRRGKHR